MLKIKLWNKNISGEIINIKEISPDENFINSFHDEFNEVKNYVSRPIGEFTKTVSAKNSLFGNSIFH